MLKSPGCVNAVCIGRRVQQRSREPLHIRFSLRNRGRRCVGRRGHFTLIYQCACCVSISPARLPSAAVWTVIYNDCDEGGARIDRLPFEYEGAPPVAATADEAFDIVSDNKRKLRRLVSLVKAECKRVNLNLAFLNETITHKTGDKFGTLLSKEELEHAVNSK